MARRFITVEDIQRAQGQELVVDSETIVTPQALEAASSMGVVIRGGASDGSYQEPTPDRGPDAVAGVNRLPHLPEPTTDSSGSAHAIATVVGRNRPGVLAEVTGALAEHGISIGDVTQKIVQDYFHLVLVLEVPPGVGFEHLKQTLECMGSPDDYAVRVMHERVFRFMHRV